jgi:hypothetical protein
MARIGHDGSKVVHPSIVGVKQFVGHHPQECITVALTLGYAATPVELFPIGNNTGLPTHEHRIYFGDDRGNWMRFMNHIRNSRGVLFGTTTSGQGHAVAYDHNTIFDPDGHEYAYTQTACEQRGLITTGLYRIDKL